VYHKFVEKRHIGGSVEVGVRELRDNLSRWIAKARRGQDVVITERGKPVARLTKYGESPALQRLIEEGRVTLPKHRKTKIDRTGLVKPRGSVPELVKDQRR
jgi:prevent-host-death family protein